MSLISKFNKIGSINSSILTTSSLFADKEIVTTDVPMLNVAFSGSMDGGFKSGLTMFAGPSRHFKTLFGLISMKAYLKKYPNSIALFYDSEFGTPKAYFTSLGINTDRVIHIPITDIEILTHDITKKINEIELEDKIFIFIDSIGNLASKKEAQDALDGKSVADMTRAKQLKSLFRIVTPHLTIKDIPMFVVNHSYKTMEMYSKDVVSGGTGGMYSSDSVYIIGRQQEKNGKDLEGYNFIINVEKSRFVKEKSKIPITVTFEKGLSKWSGLLDVALETGHVDKPKVGWYSRVMVNTDTGILVDESEQTLFRKLATNSKIFWEPIFSKTNFKSAVEKRYSVSLNELLQDTEDDNDILDTIKTLETEENEKNN